jgi:hypothetical protein
MKPLSLLPLISASIALCATPSHAGTTPVPVKDPTPGNSQKCTRVDFDHDNNGWGNGDQDAPGNSGDHNNAENGPGGNPGNNNPGNPVGPDKEESGNNGWGNGDQTPPGNSGDNNNAENAKEAATQKELQRIEAEALAKIAQQNEAAKASAAPQASVVVVARREK